MNLTSTPEAKVTVHDIIEALEKVEHSLAEIKAWAMIIQEKEGRNEWSN